MGMSNLFWAIIIGMFVITVGVGVWIYSAFELGKKADYYKDIAFEAYLEEENITSGSAVIHE
jgi:hypothetical protein